jgi:hypothetical protein
MAPAVQLPLTSLEGYVPAVNFISLPTMGYPDFGVPSSDVPSLDPSLDPSLFSEFDPSLDPPLDPLLESANFEFLCSHPSQSSLIFFVPAFWRSCLQSSNSRLIPTDSKSF